MKFLYLAAFGALIFCRRFVASYDCSNGVQYFPADLSTLPSRYPFAESNAQIFLDLVINCDEAYVTKWNFLSSTAHINGLHLAIFRPTPSLETTNQSRSFAIVDQTYINNYVVPHTVDNWVHYPPPAPIKAQKGDVVGLFYDKLGMPRDKVAVKSAMRWASNAHTLVFDIDYESKLRLSNILKGQGTLVNRVPALYLTLDSVKRDTKSMPQSFNSLLARSADSRRTAMQLEDPAMPDQPDYRGRQRGRQASTKLHRQMYGYGSGRYDVPDWWFRAPEERSTLPANSFGLRRWMATTHPTPAAHYLPSVPGYHPRCHFMRKNEVICARTDLTFVMLYDDRQLMCREFAICGALAKSMNFQARFATANDIKCQLDCKRSARKFSYPQPLAPMTARDFRLFHDDMKPSGHSYQLHDRHGVGNMIRPLPR